MADDHAAVAPPPPPPPPPPPLPQQATAYDASLGPTIRALLDQHAEIQTKLAALLPQKYGPNLKMELANLRHKLRVLRTYADDNRKPLIRLSPVSISLLCAAGSALFCSSCWFLFVLFGVL